MVDGVPIPPVQSFPKRFHRVIHLRVMSRRGPLPTVGHMTRVGCAKGGAVMLAADCTALLASERMAELHRQAEGRRLARLARAHRRGGNGGVWHERRWLAGHLRGRMKVAPQSSTTP